MARTQHPCPRQSVHQLDGHMLIHTRQVCSQFVNMLPMERLREESVRRPPSRASSEVESLLISHGMSLAPSPSTTALQALMPQAPPAPKQRKYGGRFSNGFASWLQSQDLADTTVVCNGKEYRAHMLLLANASEFFRAAFTAKFREAEERRITLGFDDPAGANRVVGCMCIASCHAACRMVSWHMHAVLGAWWHPQTLILLPCLGFKPLEQTSLLLNSNDGA